VGGASVKPQKLFIPGPVSVAPPVLAALAKPLIDHRGPAFAELLARIERQLRPLFGTAGPIVLLGSSGTGGMEASVVSLFSPGDRILACPIGLFGLRFADIARAYGCEVEVLETEFGRALDAQRLAERLRADHKRQIDGILLTHNETSTGVQNDLAALSQALGDHGAFTLVDSVSGLGAGDVRMDERRFDAVISASQKVLAAPPGAAMVALSARAVDRLPSAEIPSFYLSLQKALDFSGHGQTPWTPPVSILFALEAALERFEEQGARRVWKRHESYAGAIRAAVGALGLEMFSVPGAHSSTVVAVKSAGIDMPAVLHTLRDEHGITLSGGQQHLRGKIFRIGTMGDISQTDVLAMLGALEGALAGAHLPPETGSAVRAALQVFLSLEDEAAFTLDDEQTAGAETAEQTMAARS